jgi:RsiW-degrading membrane proteinase PrsW (M82 family)
MAGFHIRQSAIWTIFDQAALSVFPVLLFLLGLALVDTYRLLTFRRVMRTVMIGCAVAPVCWLLNTFVYETRVLPPDVWVRTGAPLLEEVAKAFYAAWLIRHNRVAFMVDAGISGFAIGAGFSVIENLSYIPDLSGMGLMASAVRGLGTAMMHGGTTAIFAVVSNNLAERRGAAPPIVFLPGITLAVGIHALYNQHLLPPVYSAVAILIALPVLMSFIFWRSEKALEKWLEGRLDRDIGLLEMMSTGAFGASHAGKYLASLRTTFSSEAVADMLCYLQVALELSARAKGDLLRREMGFPVTPDPELFARLREMDWLEVRIGRAGKLALTPLLAQSRRDIWEMRQLRPAG